MATINFEKHAPLSSFEIADGELQIGGQAATEIVRQAGGVPVYAYDRAVMAAKIHSLRQILPAGIRLHYAMKANPMPEVVEYMASLVDGIDVASGAELNVAAATPAPRDEISFAGPGKGIEELSAAIDHEIVINCESATELERIGRLADEKGKCPKVALRVNPDFQLQSSGMKMSGGAQQFGIDAEIIPQVLKQLANLNVKFHGFHIFSGSQNLKAEAIIESQIKACELAIRLSEYAPSPVHMLNIGGGLGVPYFPGEKPVDLAPIGDNLETLLQQIKTALPDAHLMIELGRYLVAEAGVYLCTVTDKKISRGQIFLITNGGLHHHLAASGNFGQVLRKNYPVAIASQIDSDTFETASVVGPLCTPLDLLANRMNLAEAQIGDTVAVFFSGAYGYTASPHLFLSHPPPVQILV